MRKKDGELVKLDLNNPVFQRQLVNLEKSEAFRVLGTLKKLQLLNWNQVYQDTGLKWEKITSVQAPAGIDTVYSLRITQGRRATAYRQDEYMRLLTIEPDHDATYGKK